MKSVIKHLSICCLTSSSDPCRKQTLCKQLRWVFLFFSCSYCFPAVNWFISVLFQFNLIFFYPAGFWERLRLHHFLPTLPCYASGEAAQSFRGDPQPAVDVHQVLPGWSDISICFLSLFSLCLSLRTNRWPEPCGFASPGSPSRRSADSDALLHLRCHWDAGIDPVNSSASQHNLVVVVCVLFSFFLHKFD